MRKMRNVVNKSGSGAPTRGSAVWKCAILAITLALVAGCSSARKIVYLPDGRSGYMAECDDDGWQKCYRRATKVCKRGSYEALDRQRSPMVLYYRCANGK